MGQVYLKPDKQAVPSADIRTCPPRTALKVNNIYIFHQNKNLYKRNWNIIHYFKKTQNNSSAQYKIFNGNDRVSNHK